MNDGDTEQNAETVTGTHARFTLGESSVRSRRLYVLPNILHQTYHRCACAYQIFIFIFWLSSKLDELIRASRNLIGLALWKNKTTVFL